MPETRISYNGPQPEWHLAGQVESMGSVGHIGASLSVLGIDPDTLTHDQRYELSRLADKARDLVAKIKYQSDPKRKEESEKERADILSLFGDERIYVEEIPNGYTDEYYAEHLPWFKVTTRRGHFVVGWRKRVINIDWSGTDIDTESVDMFPEEDVTKYGRYVHAWSLEDAGRYVTKLLEHVNEENG